MTGLMGNLCLWGATLSSATAAVCGLVARDETWLKRARGATLLSAGFVLAASGLLAWMLVAHDFTNAYVYGHTDRSLSVLFRVSALWAGQEGSILLWAMLLSAMSGLHALRAREGVSIAVLGGIVAFLTGLLVIAGSPFETRAAAADGAGLNPMLRHWAMALHPPLLFTGYAGFAVPMAMVFGWLVRHRRNTDIACTDVRRWAMFAWVSLTIGMALGAWWAYVELGWGGYWAWDPVENASLGPWLTGLALVHAIMAHRRGGGFGGWVAWLSVGTFALCVLGTALTRSGLTASVHAFAQSSLGLSFFVLLAVVCAGGAWVLVRGRRLLGESGAGAWSVHGVVRAGLWVLVAMAGATMAGTLLPLLSGAASDPVSVGPAFYGRTVLPLAVVLIGLMAAADVVRDASAGRAAWTAGGVVVCVGAGAASGFVEWRFLVCASVSGAVLGGAGFELSGMRVWARAAGSRPPFRNGFRLMAHVGMAFLAIGVAGSSVFAEHVTTRVNVGESIQVRGYTLLLEAVRGVRGEGWEAGEAVVRVRRGEGPEYLLRPQQRFYDQFSEGSTEVAVRSGLREDVHVALVGWTVGGTAASLSVHVNPLVSWLWAGAGLMASGGIGSLAPRLMWRAARETSVAKVDPAGAWSAAGSCG